MSHTSPHQTIITFPNHFSLLTILPILVSICHPSRHSPCSLLLSSPLLCSLLLSSPPLPYTHLPTWQYLHHFIPIPLSLYPSIPLSLYPSIPLSLYPSIPLSLYPSIPPLAIQTHLQHPAHEALPSSSSPSRKKVFRSPFPPSLLPHQHVRFASRDPQARVSFETYSLGSANAQKFSAFRPSVAWAVVTAS